MGQTPTQSLCTPPPPCRSPPLVVPPGAGAGDRHLVNPKFFVAAHCVVVWVTVLSACACQASYQEGKTTTQECRPKHSGGKWRACARVQGEVEQDQEILHRAGQGVGLRTLAALLNASYAECFRFMLQFLCLQMCVYGGGAVPQGGVGDRHLVTVPQGVVGDRLPWGGEGQGGGGT